MRYCVVMSYQAGRKQCGQSGQGQTKFSADNKKWPLNVVFLTFSDKKREFAAGKRG